MWRSIRTDRVATYLTTRVGANPKQPVVTVFLQLHTMLVQAADPKVTSCISLFTFAERDRPKGIQ